MGGPTRAAATLAAGAALLVLTGCGADEPQATDPEPTGAGSPTAEATSASPEPEASGSPSESATPPAATGPVLRMPSAEVTMPAGWTKFEQLMPATDAARLGKGTGVITLAEVDSFDDSTNDELARIAMRMSPYAGDVEQRPDVVVDGVPMYHLVGKEGAKSLRSFSYEEFGTVHDDQVVKLILDLDGRAPLAERQAIRDQVLATFTWR